MAWAYWTGGKAGAVHPYDLMIAEANLLGFDLPNSTQQSIDRQKIDYLIDINAWDEFDKIHIFNNTYTPTSFATNFYRLNWKNPKSYLLEADSGLEPDWVSGSGFKVGNASGKFLRTDYIPSVDAVKYDTDSGSDTFALFDVETVYTGAKVFYGARDNDLGRQVYYFQSANNRISTRIFSGNASAIITQANINQHYFMKISLGVRELFINGINTALTWGVAPNGAPSLPTFEIYLFALNNAGITVTSPLTAGIKYWLTGSNLVVDSVNLNTPVYEILNEIYTP